MLTKIKLSIAVITSSVVLLLPTSVLASTYGSGSYGNCPYGESCASTSTGSAGGSPSSSTGSGTTTSSSSAGQIILNDFSEYFSADGKQLNLKSNQIVYFELTLNGVTKRYSATIKSVGTDYVDIVINPGSITGRLYVGDSNKYDVNKDNSDDIEITLNDINSGIADMTFRALYPDTTPVPGSNNSAGQPSSEGNANKTKSYFWPIIFGLLTIAGIGILIFLVKKRRSKNSSI